MQHLMTDDEGTGVLIERLPEVRVEIEPGLHVLVVESDACRGDVVYE